jgi:hypothetical protein
MYIFQIALLTLCLLSSGSSAFPAAPIFDLFTDASIPFLENDSALSDFNLTTPSEDTPGLPKRALQLEYVKYSITIDGRNQNNFENFLVSGPMLVTTGISSPGTTTGANPVEVIISIGSPTINPIAGSIRYCTNRALYKFIGGSNVNSLLDFSEVTLKGSTVGVTVDSRLAAANQLSQFNARSGVTANVFLIASGGFSFTVAQDGTVSGRINVQGKGYISPGTAPYKASIGGKVIGKGTITI